MALVPCPECRHQVSSMAASCPNCGVALAAQPSAAAVVPALSPPAVVVPGPSGPERTVWEGRPSLGLLVFPLVRAGVVIAALCVGAVFVAASLARFIADLSTSSKRSVPAPDDSTATLILAAAIGAYVLLQAIQIGTSAARLRATQYRITNQRIVVESGLVARGLAEVDLRSVDDLSFGQTPLERLQGIGSVTVVSSDKTAPRLTLQGIRDPRALRELVRSHAYEASQRQLFTRAT